MIKNGTIWGGILALLLLAAPTYAQEKGAVEAGAQTVGVSGALPNLGDIAIETGNVYDYTFTTAPTDWWVQSGVWEMTNRWSCAPGWSWFGGRSEEVAAVWNKRRFAGDLSIHFYFAFKMGLTGAPAWYYRPSDVALSFFGDGKNLGSGYSLIIGADGNRRSLLLKGDQIVAQSQNKAALLPILADGQPEMNALHRHWWYVRVEKVGDRIECYLDNKLFLTYDDPAPLDSGQLALWTFNNGIMVSRVQIYYEQELQQRARKVVRLPGEEQSAKPQQVSSRPADKARAKAQG